MELKTKLEQARKRLTEAECLLNLRKEEAEEAEASLRDALLPAGYSQARVVSDYYGGRFESDAEGEENWVAGPPDVDLEEVDIPGGATQRRIVPPGVVIWRNDEWVPLA